MVPQGRDTEHRHSGKSATIRESNDGSGVRKENYAKYCVPNAPFRWPELEYGKKVL